MEYPLTRVPRWRRISALLVLCLGLTTFYVKAAAEHGRMVNTSKARGDQSGYLWDAENVYANWHGRRPPTVIGERNRMPVYAGYLALFYNPRISDPEFFEIAKGANIGLSLALLAIIALLVVRELPFLPAMNLVGVAAFGYFIFKAPYAQSELLFYFFFFAAFLGCWHLLRSQPDWRAIILSGVTAALAALAYLTKAAILPFVVIFAAAYAAPLPAALESPARGWEKGAVRSLVWRAAVALVFVLAFLAVMGPYLATSRRVFGHYFYNVNTFFYVWNDDWPQASARTYIHGDGVGWPTMPDSEIPGPVRYWREHTVPQIATRIWYGFGDMILRSYQMYGYWKYLVLYGGMFGLLLATRRSSLWEMIEAHSRLSIFLALYGLAYLLLIAFYTPVSGTGTGRFVLVHALPLFFVLSRIFTSARLRDARWNIAGLQLQPAHFHLLVAVVIGVEVAFGVWPRLMTTYGGF